MSKSSSPLPLLLIALALVALAAMAWAFENSAEEVAGLPTATTSASATK